MNWGNVGGRSGRKLTVGVVTSPLKGKSPLGAALQGSALGLVHGSSSKGAAWREGAELEDIGGCGTPGSRYSSILAYGCPLEPRTSRIINTMFVELAVPEAVSSVSRCSAMLTIRLSRWEGAKGVCGIRLWKGGNCQPAPVKEVAPEGGLEVLGADCQLTELEAEAGK